MSETQHHVDIDLTALPAQRAATHDVLEIIHRPDPPAAATASPVRLALIVAAAVAITFAVLIPLGLAISAPAHDLAPVPPRPGNGDISGLLVGPLSAQRSAQPSYPTDQQQLIQSMLTP